MNIINYMVKQLFVCLIAIFSAMPAIANTTWEDNIENIDIRARPFLTDSTILLFVNPFNISFVREFPLGKQQPRACLGAAAKIGQQISCHFIALRDNKTGNIITFIYPRKGDKTNFVFVTYPNKQKRIFQLATLTSSTYSDETNDIWTDKYPAWIEVPEFYGHTNEGKRTPFDNTYNYYNETPIWWPTLYEPLPSH